MLLGGAGVAVRRPFEAADLARRPRHLPATAPVGLVARLGGVPATAPVGLAPSAPRPVAGSVVNRCGGGWSAVADAPSAPRENPSGRGGRYTGAPDLSDPGQHHHMAPAYSHLAEGNDADHLADDPIHKLLLGRDPVSGAPLASQPTISRFENGARRSVLYRMGRELAACVIERHRRRLHGRARRITIDLDPTDDLTHGAQQLTFFNGHYGGWCYLPMLGFLSFDREAEQYLCAAVLRPGKAVAADGTLGLLSRLLPLLRAAFPQARFLVRLDGGFATPEIQALLGAYTFFSGAERLMRCRTRPACSPPCIPCRPGL